MKKLIVVFAFLTAFMRPAAAQWAVIDVTNLQQNVMNTISTFTQEYQQIQQYVTQLQQLQYEYMQLKGIANGDVSGILGTVNDALNVTKEYQSGLKLLYGDLNSAKDVLDGLFGRMSASGLSDADWMTREAERNQELQNGNGFLDQYEANVLGQVAKRYEQVQGMQEKITSTGGTHEAMQLMNSQMNALLATTNQMLESNALAARRDLNRDAEQLGRSKARMDGEDAYRKAAAEASKAADAEISKIQ